MRPDCENRLAYICSQLQPRGYTMSTRTTTTVVNNGLSSRALADNLVHALARPAADTPAVAYTMTARTLHWITAVLILFMIPSGFMAANEWGGSWQDSLYDMHKSIGALIIPLIMLRLIYRWVRPPSRLPADIQRMQRLVAATTHWALYALLVLQPLAGWIATSAYPAPVPLFGWITLPPLWFEDRALSDLLFLAHRFVGIVILSLVAMHVAGALYHHFVRKDRVLMRMITG
jgi:cytochrome b561